MFNNIIYILYILYYYVIRLIIGVCFIGQPFSWPLTLNIFSQPLKRRKISSVATTWKYVNAVLSEEEKEGKSRDTTGARAITKLSPCNNYAITPQYQCFHLTISMLFGRFFGRFGRKKTVIFLAFLQCSDSQSIAEWARIAYLRTDFLAWILFVNKLTFCALE